MRAICTDRTPDGVTMRKRRCHECNHVQNTLEIQVPDSCYGWPANQAIKDTGRKMIMLTNLADILQDKLTRLRYTIGAQ
jgi:hypothetical protein